MPNTAADAPIHVAVGILTDRNRVFVARRAADAHQGGKWEFPGGKVHAHESVFAALQRELHEELGVEVTDARPFMQVHHAYADKAVFLDVWAVTHYRGEPHGKEGQEVCWLARDAAFTLDFPLADLPIQRRLWLPPLYAISDCQHYGRDVFFDRLEQALIGGLRLLQLREPTMATPAYDALAREVVGLCRQYGAKVLLNADPASVTACGADGVHLNSARLMQTRTRPLPQEFFVGASCHNEHECRQAHAIGADLIVLGAVAPTRTHPDVVPLGWEIFRHLSADAVPAVYALGGLHAGDLPRARASGAHGLSMIRGLWDAADVAAEVARCIV